MSEQYETMILEKYGGEEGVAVVTTTETGKGFEAKISHKVVEIDEELLNDIIESQASGMIDEYAENEEIPIYISGMVALHNLRDGIKDNLILDENEVENPQHYLGEKTMQLNDAQLWADDTLLSPREIECWMLTQKFGFSQKDAAALLGIASGTVKVHLRNLRQKKEKMNQTKKFFRHFE